MNIQSKSKTARVAAFAIPLAMATAAMFGIGLPYLVAISVPVEPELKVELPRIDLAQATHGHNVYAMTCVACHGPDAKGVVNLGKDLTSGFAFDSDDLKLVAMIMKGRQPGEPGHTAALPMPPKGGRADLRRSDIEDVVAYLRCVQVPSRLTEPLPPLEAPAIATASPSSEKTEPREPNKPVAAEVTAPHTTAAAISTSFSLEAAARGKRVFNSCIACHGKTGTGVANLGADLVHSTFVSSRSDEELVAFIKRGRLPTDPDTRLKLSMPPKGGNPALKDEQISDVVAYIRSLQASETASR